VAANEIIFVISINKGYIGKRHLQKAMTHVISNPLTAAELEFAVLRVPFLLEPHYDESRPFIESNRERLTKKWGGKEGWERQKYRHDLKGRGEAAGIPYFNLDRLASNSMASHRLIQHVGKRYGLNISERLYDRLNVYYFVEGHALNDRPRLAKVAAETLSQSLAQSKSLKDTHQMMTPPMSEKDILEFLNGDEGRLEIENALRALNELGVHGIPKFIVEGSTIVDGAAGAETFVRIFREIEQRGEVAGPAIFKDILGIDEETLNRGSHSRESLR
jgi:predicted DsbA family dithiol-disulfide isomerase